MHYQYWDELNDLVLMIEKLISTMEDAPNHLNALGEQERERKYIKLWDLNVVSKVRAAHLILINSINNKPENIKDALGFFVRFPGIYGANLFAQWSIREKEIDFLFDQIFELANKLSTMKMPIK